MYVHAGKFLMLLLTSVDFFQIILPGNIQHVQGVE